MSTFDLLPRTPPPAAKCAFCLAAVAGIDLSCPHCGAWHHRDCAAEVQSCAVCAHQLLTEPPLIGAEASPEADGGQAAAELPNRPSPELTPAGWYPDPNDESLARWWDGRVWTGATQLVGSVPIALSADGSGGADSDKARKKKAGWLIGGAIAASVAVIAMIGSATTAGPVQVDYSIDVAKGCYETSWGYADVSPGASVRVEDGSGTVLGMGVLQGGTSSGYGRCEYTATFDVDPSEDGTYQVTSGNANRGYLYFDEDDVHSGTLRVNSTLG